MDPVPSNSTALGAVAMQVTVGVMSVCESTSPLCACSSGYALCSRHVFCLTISVSPAPSALSPLPTPARLYLHLPLPLCPSSSLSLGRLFLSISVLFSIPLSLSLLLSSQSSPPPSLPLLSPPSPSFLLHSLFVCHSLPPHRLYFFLYLISRFPVTQLQ